MGQCLSLSGLMKKSGFWVFINLKYKTIIQYCTVKPNLKGSAVLLRSEIVLILKKGKIKKREIPDLIYLLVHPIDTV